MSEHTKGPWEIGHRFEKDSLHNIWTKGRVPDHHVLVARTCFAPNSAANAHLIAAAPDLYEELKHLVALMEPDEESGNLHIRGLATLNGARAALAKAEGR